MIHCMEVQVALGMRERCPVSARPRADQASLARRRRNERYVPETTLGSDFLLLLRIAPQFRERCHSGYNGLSLVFCL